MLGWLFSTVDKKALGQVIYYKSAAEVWTILENLYSQQTVVRSFQLKQFRSVKKNDKSVNDYILKIKTIGHALATIGEPLRDKDLLMAILHGLDDEQEMVIGLIIYQMVEISIENVQYLLVMHEQRLVIKSISNVSSVHGFDSATVHVNVASQLARGGGSSS